MSKETDLFDKIYYETSDDQVKWKIATFVESQRLCEIFEKEAMPQKTYYLFGKNKSIVAVGTFVYYDYPEGEQTSRVDYFFSIGKTKKDYLQMNELDKFVNNSVEVEMVRTYTNRDLGTAKHGISDLYKLIVESHLQIDSMIDDF